MTVLSAILPLLIVAATAVAVMLAIAVRRDHAAAAGLAAAGLAASVLALLLMPSAAPVAVTDLLLVDATGRFYLAVVLLAALGSSALAYPYFEQQGAGREEFYILVLIAALGCAVLTLASHVASLFLGIELLSVPLYTLAAYHRHRDRSIEAGIKYLMLAALSSAIVVFGAALLYAETGALGFAAIAAKLSGPTPVALAAKAGIGMIVAGLGFKLALVPFHLWTPDVYEGAPLPATAFIATASKGAVFALLLRFVGGLDLQQLPWLVLGLSSMAAASMVAGNLLALFQSNVKRILAYSSIAHLGYLLVTVLASGPQTGQSAGVYVASYVTTSLGAFGVLTALSTAGRDADQVGDLRGLAWERPALAGVFAVMLLSLAGIPLTAGFMGKYLVLAAGVRSGLWFLVVLLVITSVIGLFYYLRLLSVLFERQEEDRRARPAALSMTVLAVLTLLLFWIGTYPGPLLRLL